MFESADAPSRLGPIASTKPLGLTADFVEFVPVHRRELQRIIDMLVDPVRSCDKRIQDYRSWESGYKLCEHKAMSEQPSVKFHRVAHD